MDRFRKIDISTYAKVDPPSSFGRPPKLQWLGVKHLVIDPEYQREVTPKGRKNVRCIAAEFNWSMFTPVIVASVGGNLFAVVDGQHRVTAAALCGVENVPCFVIEAHAGQQAAAFRAINGNTTQLHTVQLFRASVAAGDLDAIKVNDLCARAGVNIVRNPTSIAHMKIGDTQVVGTIAKAMERFGDAATEAALRIIIGTGGGNRGLLNRVIVWGCAEVLNDHPEWRDAGQKLTDAFDDIDLESAWRDATTRASRIRGTSPTDQFEAALVQHLTNFFSGRKVA